MGLSTTTATSSTASRLKREDFRRPKHDSAFSPWKVLVGASDWEDHSKGKEGAEKYRTQNLPYWTRCPGVYELGIGVPHQLSGREARKFDSSSVVPVYLGQADNLRNRLQQYGRDGAHLENGCSNGKFTNNHCISSHKGPLLFSDVFSRGFPIVYRFAPMQSKNDAEITEKQLLSTFDYAWNKGSNGVRRHDDVCRKLYCLSKASKFSLLAKKLFDFNRKQVGIKIRTCKADIRKNDRNLSDMDSNATVSRIFGIRRLQPREVQCGSGDYDTHICGVVLGHGTVCTTPPVKGRKRCAMHKGMRGNSYISKLNTEGKKSSNSGSLDSADKLCNGFHDQRLSNSRETPHEQASICGFILDDGSLCQIKHIPGNKRCLEHKGRRIRKSKPLFLEEIK